MKHMAPCSSCGKKAPLQGGPCPACGAATGFRDEILKIAASGYAWDKGAVFRFGADAVRGKAALFPFGWTFLISFILFIAGMEMLHKYPQHQGWLLWVMFPAYLTMPVGLVGFLVAKFRKKGPRWFELKFSAQGPEWSCADPDYWASVKDKLLQASRGELPAALPETPEQILQQLAGLAVMAGGLQMVAGLKAGEAAEWVGSLSFAAALSFAATKGPKAALVLLAVSMAALGFSLRQASQGLVGLGGWAWVLPFVASFSLFVARKNARPK